MVSRATISDWVTCEVLGAHVPAHPLTFKDLEPRAAAAPAPPA
jgi:hypothetical protein